MGRAGALLVPFLLALASIHSLAFDPSPLQDFCVADVNSKVRVNGFTCKDPMDVNVDDFVFHGIDKPRNTENRLGSNVTSVTVENLPGLNTLGVSLARIDYAPRGLNPPHIHPRATEVLTVLHGTLYAGFFTAEPNGRLFAKVLKKGDIIVFPFAQIHFQMNLGNNPAVALSSLSSQFPGVVQVAPTLFGSNPPVDDEVLARAFQIDERLVKILQKLFRSNKLETY